MKGAIGKKIALAEALYEKWAQPLREDPAIEAQLHEIAARVSASESFSRLCGVSQVCTLCDREEGGSCCGAGIEDRYTPELLLMNLLIGVTLPESRHCAKSCHFLGERGCILHVRDILCINYLCSKIKETITTENLFRLQEVNGLEMDLIFLLHDRIRNFIRSRE
jgi:hypothetical protein